MKVLGFDSWTGGHVNLDRLVPAFTDQGIEFLVVHVGSWGVDPGRPREEVVGAVRYRDVSYYDGATFDAILDHERPDVVLFLSTRTFAHRAFQRYCRVKGIPTIHLYHGLVRVQDVDGETSPHRPNVISFGQFVVRRIWKSLRRTWPAYAQALWQTHATGSEWLRFAVDVVNLGRGHLSLVAAADARTTKCCVYCGADVSHAVVTYGFDEADVVPVGNPDLVAFRLVPRMIGNALESLTCNLPDVMYIDTALVAIGAFFRSDADFVDHMLKLRDALGRQGKILMFKPHPDTRRRGIDVTLANAGVEIVANDDLTKRLTHCCAAIVETSTLAMIPALMGMPLLLAGFGKLAPLSFGEVLRSYPRARVLDDPERITAVLEAEAASCDRDATTRWIDQNAGPLPASAMPTRVAQLAMALARSVNPAREQTSDSSGLATAHATSTR